MDEPGRRKEAEENRRHREGREATLVVWLSEGKRDGRTARLPDRV